MCKYAFCTTSDVYSFQMSIHQGLSRFLSFASLRLFPPLEQGPSLEDQVINLSSNINPFSSFCVTFSSLQCTSHCFNKYASLMSHAIVILEGMNCGFTLQPCIEVNKAVTALCKPFLNKTTMPHMAFWGGNSINRPILFLQT